MNTLAPPALPGGVEDGLYELALEACPQALTLVDVRDPLQPLVYVNQAFELLTGYPRAEALGRNCDFLQGPATNAVAARRLRQAIEGGERAMVTLQSYRKDGSAFAGELLLEPIGDHRGTVTHFVGLLADVSERDRRRGDGAAAPRRRDPRRGRAMLDDRIEQSLVRARTVGTQGALFLIELGSGGDPALADDELAHSRFYEVAGAIGEAVPEAGTSLTCLDDDRLALLLDPAPTPLQVAGIARRVHAAIGSRLARRRDGTSCHLGIALAPADGDSAQQLRLAARRALDRARLRAPSGDVAFFADALDAQLVHLRGMEHDLAAALAGDAFDLAYQPVVELDSGRLVGFEALLRWNHAQRGAVAPDDFIPVAEATGLAAALDDWVLDHALTQLARFDAVGGGALRLHVNIGTGRLETPDFAAVLRHRLAQHGIAAGRVELEFTERRLGAGAPATPGRLRALREQGVTLAIDDFGTGSSNLYHLTQLPIDALKIDLSTTHGAPRSAAAASVARMICELGRTLGLDVVVEGIETAAQLAHFRRLGCPKGQGFLFSPPLDAAAALALVATGRPLGGPAPARRRRAGAAA
ncbi:MAG: EAL domain-containing protein [Burkholderiales bacterium]|nr:EAL domain-containing protein [Burkholderiales bacterium]